MFFFGQNRCCHQQVTPCRPSCGVDIVITPSTNVARVCTEVLYTVTITNNTQNVCRDCILRIETSDALFADPSTITINGTPITDGDLTALEIGTLGPCETIVVTYVATVMECRRYIKTRARLDCCVCCCFDLKPHAFESKCNVIQVCCCCPGTTPTV